MVRPGSLSGPLNVKPPTSKPGDLTIKQNYFDCWLYHSSERAKTYYGIRTIGYLLGGGGVSSERVKTYYGIRTIGGRWCCVHGASERVKTYYGIRTIA